MPEGIIILEPGDEQSQKIARAMASPMAGDIIRVISQGEKTSSDVSRELSIPITTAKYHIENLLDAGLIEIARHRYSVKGREVKIYRLTDRLVIMAPRQTDIRALLARFGGMVLVLVVAAFLFAAIVPSYAPSPDLTAAGGHGSTLTVQDDRVFEMHSPEPSSENTATVEKALYGPESRDLSQGPLAGPDAKNAPYPLPVVSFIAGGVLVIGVLLAWEIIRTVREYRKGISRRPLETEPPGDDKDDDTGPQE